MKNALEESKCPKCGFDRDPEAVECSRCGIIFEKYEMILKRKAKSAEKESSAEKGTACKSCLKVIPAYEKKTCPHCGVKISTNPDDKNKPKNTMVTAA